jgi:hypothetical protein
LINLEMKNNIAKYPGFNAVDEQQEASQDAALEA